MSLQGMNMYKTDSWIHRAHATQGRFGKANTISKGDLGTAQVVGDEVKEMSRPQTASSRRPASAMSRPQSAANPYGFSYNASPYSRPGSAAPGRVPMSPSQNNFETINFFDNTQRTDTTTRPVTPKVPHFVETEKQVLRFYAHFFDFDVQQSRKPLRKFQSASTARLLTILVYVEDNTIEINEERNVNSGIMGGPFYKRSALKKKDKTNYTARDFRVGGGFTALGRDFYITDCDEFTRKYFKREFGITMPDALPRPEVASGDIGAQNATGLGGTLPPRMKSSNGTRSTDYLVKKELIDKTMRFLNYDGRVLRFRCVELSDASHGMVDSMLGKGKKYALSYYLSDDNVEVRIIKDKRGTADEANLLLKKCKLPKNWRDAPRGGHLEYYGVYDFICGSTIDVYGRKLFLYGCDESTREYYAEQGIEQQEMELQEPQEIIYERTIPQLGDGFLAIGGEEDTLHSVYGHPKPTRNWKKIQRNIGRTIRCNLKMISDNSIDTSRNFMLTFFLEDDSVGIFEEVIRNSGIVGGTFLKRGQYINGLPPDSDVPRPFKPTDFYLGNVISINGYEMQITLMDDMTVQFCEEHPDEFPLFDAFSIMERLMEGFYHSHLDVRSKIMKHYDIDRKNWLTKEVFVACLDDMQIHQELNDQEMMTVLRCFKSPNDAKTQEKYYYHEMCDVLSHAHYMHSAGQRNNNKDRSDVGIFLESLRGRQTQWRRVIRQDFHSIDDNIILGDLVRLFRKHGVELSYQNKAMIKSNFALHPSLAAKLLPALQAQRELDNLARTAEINASTSTAKMKIPGSPSSKSRHPSVTTAPATKINARRNLVAKPILRAQSYSSHSGDDATDDLDEECTVINYNDFCNDIYICDWV